MSDQNDDLSEHYREFHKLEIKTKLDTIMFTLVHTCAVDDLFLLKWLVSRQLNNIFVCAIKHNVDEINDSRIEEVHKDMFMMQLEYDVTINNSPPNQEELDSLDLAAKSIINKADNNTTGGELNIITLIKPPAYFVSSLLKYIKESTSNVKHIIVINAIAKYEELNNPPCHIYRVHANRMIYGASAQKIINVDTTNNKHKGAIAMIKYIENVSINPMFNVFAYMLIAETCNIDSWIEYTDSEQSKTMAFPSEDADEIKSIDERPTTSIVEVTGEIVEAMNEIKLDHSCKSTDITIISMEKAAAALSYFIQGMLIANTTY